MNQTETMRVALNVLRCCIDKDISRPQRYSHTSKREACRAQTQCRGMSWRGRSCRTIWTHQGRNHAPERVAARRRRPPDRLRRFSGNHACQNRLRRNILLNALTPEEVKKAFDVCDAAFQRYIKEATQTHKMLSSLLGVVSVEQRLAVNDQRVRENDAQFVYIEARNALFEVLRVVY